MKLFGILAVVFCMVFCFCSCGDGAKTQENTVAETVVNATVTLISEDEAIKMVEEKYNFGKGYSYLVRRTEKIDGVSYYGVDLIKSNGATASYQTTYFVVTDGSKIVEGYYENDKPYLVE